MTTRDLSDIIAIAERLLAAGEIPVLATLFSSTGSTYRPLGSMMVAGPGSMSAGGVSGGCVEEYIARRGRSLVQNGSAALLSFDADPDADGSKPSLGCGGAIEVLVERATRDHVEFLKRLRDARHADTCSAAACVVRRCDSDDSFDVERVWPDGKSFPDADLEALRLHATELAQSRHSALDSSRRALVHYIPPMTRLVIFGAGEDARPLCTLARSLGWHVTVADRRARLATWERFADADDVIAADWASAVSKITFTPRTAVVMMTHGLADDVELLPLLADKPATAASYVGALGPPHRRQWVLDDVAAAGIALPASFAARFRGPIGLNLGDRSPAGIAVSVVSEILAELNGRSGRPLSDAPEGIRRQSADV